MDGLWIPDPALRHRLRYWDGQAWTPWVADGLAAFIDDDPSPVPAGVAPLTPPSKGWYSDPIAPEALRYFDGGAWTEHTHSRRARKVPIALAITGCGVLVLSIVALVTAGVVSGMDTRPVSEDELATARLLAIAALNGFLIGCVALVLAPLWAWALGLPPRGHRRRRPSQHSAEKSSVVR